MPRALPRRTECPADVAAADDRDLHARTLRSIGMNQVRDYSDELDGYAYLPRMFDGARAKLAADMSAPPFGCPLDHSCLARLHVYPEEVLELVRVHGNDDQAMLA